MPDVKCVCKCCFDSGKQRRFVCMSRNNPSTKNSHFKAHHSGNSSYIIPIDHPEAKEIIEFFKLPVPIPTLGIDSYMLPTSKVTSFTFT